jgi:hypothetical protein
MTFTTTQQLQALGLHPAVVATGRTFQKSGHFYQGAEFLSEAKGIKLFRTTCDGKPRMIGQEQMISIFA